MQHTRLARLRAAAVGVCGSIALLSAAPAVGQVPSGYNLQLLGLTGGQYEINSPGGFYRETTLTGVNALGYVAGQSRGFNQHGIGVQGDAWVWNGTTTQRIGLWGGEYELDTDNLPGGVGGIGGIVRDSVVQIVSSGVYVGGSSQRYGPPYGSPLGRDTWVWNGSQTVQVGFTGDGYQKQESWGYYRYSNLNGLNGAGQAVGTSERYGFFGDFTGYDAWIWQGGTTTRLGLTGSVYNHVVVIGGSWPFVLTDTYRDSFVNRLTESGRASGQSVRYNSAGGLAGEDAWIYNGSTTQQVGLTGAGYFYNDTTGTAYRSSYVTVLTEGVYAAGRSDRYAGFELERGWDAWIWTGSTHTQVGILDAAHTNNGYRASDVYTINVTGRAIGVSYFFDSSGEDIGYDAWFYNGTTTQAIGLTGAGYDHNSGGVNRRYNDPYQLNDAGHVVGATDRLNSAGEDTGRDVWMWTGSQTRRLGYVGAGYETNYTDGPGGGVYRKSYSNDLNAAGQTIGASDRFVSLTDATSLGRTGWFYDVNTDVTTKLEFSIRSTDGYSYTSPNFLTDEGLVLGDYQLFDGSTDLGSRAFLWGLDEGFHDLGALIDGTLTAEGWQHLATLYSFDGYDLDGDLTFLVGTGWTTGQTGGRSAYLAFIPEPAGVSLILLPAMTFLTRRQRRRSAASGG